MRALLVGALLTGGALPASAAASLTGLGKAGFGTIVVDNSRQHVFVSGPKAKRELRAATAARLRGAAAEDPLLKI